MSPGAFCAQHKPRPNLACSRLHASSVEHTNLEGEQLADGRDLAADALVHFCSVPLGTPPRLVGVAVGEHDKDLVSLAASPLEDLRRLTQTTSRPGTAADTGTRSIWRAEELAPAIRAKIARGSSCR